MIISLDIGHSVLDIGHSLFLSYPLKNENEPKNFWVAGKARLSTLKVKSCVFSARYFPFSILVPATPGWDLYNYFDRACAYFLPPPPPVVPPPLLPLAVS